MKKTLDIGFPPRYLLSEKEGFLFERLRMSLGFSGVLSVIGSVRVTGKVRRSSVANVASP